MAKSTKKPTKQPGRCVFCNDTGLSKEHIWSDWLRTLIPKNDAHGESRAGISVAAHTRDVRWTIEPFESTRQGPVISRKVRNVCVKCNNGWMSDVVNQAKPVVEKMARAETANISPEDLTRLAGWIALTNVMFEFANPAGARAIRESDRMFLMQHKVPPESWSIWIGLYVGENWEPFGNIHIPFKYNKSANATERSRELPDKFELQISTFSVRHLLAQVFTSTADYRVEEYRGVVREMRWNLIQIWPLTKDNLQWPPVKAIEDVQLESIISAWVRSETGMDETSVSRLLGRDIDRAMIVLRAVEAILGRSKDEVNGTGVASK